MPLCGRRNNETGQVTENGDLKVSPVLWLPELERIPSGIPMRC